MPPLKSYSLTSSQIEVDANMQMKNAFTILLPNLQKSNSKIHSYLLDYAKLNGKEKTLISIDDEAGVDDILEDVGMWYVHVTFYSTLMAYVPFPISQKKIFI